MPTKTPNKLKVTPGGVLGDQGGVGLKDGVSHVGCTGRHVADKNEFALVKLQQVASQCGLKVGRVQLQLTRLVIGQQRMSVDAVSWGPEGHGA